jgi:thiol-disulfide isomerase/thioredoxin
MAIGVGGSASAFQAPTANDVEARISAFREWQAAAGPDARDRAKYTAKVEELFGDLDFATLDMAGIALVRNYVGISPTLTEKLNARIDMLKADPGADGAAAAAMAIPGAMRNGPEAMRDAILATINHAGFTDAVKNGTALEVFDMIGYIDADTLAGMKDEVLGLAKVFENDLPGKAWSSAVSYQLALNNLGDAVDPVMKEATRARIAAGLAAAVESETDANMQRRLASQSKFINGAFARGMLIDHPAPELTFTWSHTPGGTEFASLADFKGKVVVLDFWATWCGPCIASFPNVKELQERYNGYDVVIVGVTSIQGFHIDPDQGRIDCTGDPKKEMDLMPSFITAKEVSWPVAFSEQEVFNPDFGVRGIPHVAIIDAEGKVRYNGLHPANPLVEKAAKIDALLKEAGLAAPAPLPGQDEAHGG